MIHRVLLGWLLGLAMCANAEASMEDLFHWGEYDSLIRILEKDRAESPGVSRPKDQADSAALAKRELYLGIAYFSHGRRISADEALRRACRLDRRITLEKFYVTEAAYDHFEIIAAAEGLRPDRKSGNGTEKRVEHEDSERNPNGEGQGPAAGTSWVGTRAKWMIGGLAGAAVLTTGSVLYLEYGPRKPKNLETLSLDMRK